MNKSDKKINYLRIGVTDRCNLRCSYCIPKIGANLNNRKQILSFEEIERITKIFVSLGIEKIRFTGGEPLVRPQLASLIKKIRDISPDVILSLTTNGVLLSDFAFELKKSGLDWINVSLDTLDESKFLKITGVDAFKEVIEGISKAINFFNIKINVVLMKDINDDEIYDFLEFAREYPVLIRFIELMPGYGCGTQDWYKYYVPMDRVIEGISTKYKVQSTKGEKEEAFKANHMKKNGPAEYLFIEELGITVGFIRPISNCFCSHCNRIRLTADGMIKSCLFRNNDINIKELVRKNVDDFEIIRLLEKVVSEKTAPSWEICENKVMAQIGG